MVKQYIFNMFLAADQFFNALLLGDPDESVSTRISRSLKSGNPKSWIPCLGKAVDFLFHNPLYTIEKNHIENSFEPCEKAEKELWSWIKDES